MKSIGNLGGILYYEETPILKFKFKHGIPMEHEVLTDNINLLPFEFKFHDLYDGLILFFEDRPTPDTRIGIHEELKETPIQYYDVERILRFNHAQCIHDCYWIEQDDDISCWKGSPLEGIGVTPNKDWNNIITSLKFKD